jgi:hypothetical protein
MLKKIILVIVLAFFFGVTFVFVRNANIKKTHDVNDFHTGNYVEYNGGEEAKQFFDEYANLDAYRNIDFHYYDGDKVITIYDAWCKTMFALDVWYEEDVFFETVDEILKDTHKTTLSDNNYKDDGFQCYIITREDDLYVNNYAAFFIDVKLHTIRYFFLYNVPHDPKEVANLRMYTDFTMSMPWNGKPSDWIFDYSDIVDSQ